MDRRDFLLGLGTITVASALPLKAQAKPALKGLSILQGYTNETTTQLTVDVDKDAKVSYALTDVQTKKVISPDYVKPVTFKGKDVRVDKLKFSGLELGHKYSFTVKDNKNKLLDERYLTPCDLSKTNARIALMSCMNIMFGDKDKIWPQAEAADVDYIFILGDAVYADLIFMHGPGYYWNQFVETREEVPLYRWKNLKPVLAVWDDHDFGKNDGNGNYKYKNQAFHTYKAFFAQEPDNKNLYDGYANSFFFSAFNQNFVFFDNRYYRDLINADGSKSFLGKPQIDWMMGALKNRNKPTMIMEGSPFYSGVEKGGSYQVNNQPELDYLMGKLKSLNVPIIFAAGDLHLSEIATVPKQILGYDTFEIVSSCMHSTKKKKFYSHPHTQLFGHLNENFIVIQQTGLAGDAAWKTTCIGEEAVAFETVLKVG